MAADTFPQSVAYKFADTGERRYPTVGEYYFWRNVDGCVTGPHEFTDDMTDGMWAGSWVAPPEHFAIYQRIVVAQVEDKQPEHRLSVERQIVERVVDAFLAAGYECNGDNGGDDLELPNFTYDRATILGAMMAADEDYLRVRKTSAVCEADNLDGWVHLVYGNGWDTISNYSHSSRFQPIMEPVCDWCDTEAGR